VTLIDESALDERIREIARQESRRPAFVNQRTVEQVVDLPRRHYLRLARAGGFPTVHERRLVIARTADVLRVFESRMCTTSANDALVADDAESVALARIGARRVAS
jgi:hypothetical protein